VQADLFKRMSAQAVVFCNSYARRCIKARNLPAAAELLRKSEDMTGAYVADYPGTSLLSHQQQKEKACASILTYNIAGRRALRGWTMDTHAEYYFQRKKMNAALHYMQRAMDQIARIKSAEGKVSLERDFVMCATTECLVYYY
jgi:hypothetical protein